MTRSAREPLEKELCEKAMRLAFDKARQFLVDAEALSAQGRYQSAIILGIHAFEEVGKAAVLAWGSTLDPQSEKEWKEFWKAVLDHHSKLESAMSDTASTWLMQAMGMEGDELKSYLACQAKMFHDFRIKAAYVKIDGETAEESRIVHGNQCSEVLSAVRSVLRSDKFLPHREPKGELGP